MSSRFLCWFGIHAGKYSAHWEFKETITTPGGVVTARTFKRQERYCSECNTYQMRDVKIGEEVHQPWSASYPKNVEGLNK